MGKLYQFMQINSVRMALFAGNLAGIALVSRQLCLHGSTSPESQSAENYPTQRWAQQSPGGAWDLVEGKKGVASCSQVISKVRLCHVGNNAAYLCEKNNIKIALLSHLMDKETKAETVELLLGPSTGLAKQVSDSSPQNFCKEYLNIYLIYLFNPWFE